MRFRSLPFLLTLALALATACAPVAYTGRKRLLLTSEQEELALGVQAYPELTSDHAVVVSGPDHDRVQRVMQRLVAEEPTQYSWEVKLLDAPDIVNAWCLPGGKMAVYTGLLPLCPDDDSLAAVMGHEIAHALARHSGERLSQQRLTELGISLTAAAVDERYQAEVVAALGVGAQLGIVLPYSREHEYEADEIGLILMVKAGYDPRAAVALWDRMAARGGDRSPEFLSTHPYPEKRARRLQSLIPGIVERYSGRPQR